MVDWISADMTCESKTWAVEKWNKYFNWNTKLYKKLDSFLNACIAYRILLTISVTVAFT